MPDAIISMNQTLLGQSVANVTAWSNVTEDEDELQDFADNLRFSWTGLVDELVQEWSLDNLSISFISFDQITYSVTVDFTAGPLSGTNTGDALPPTNAMLVSTIYVGPRPNRGRVYFCGLPESAQSDGIWNVGTHVQFRNMVENWANGINADQNVYFLRILRRPNPPEFPIYVSNPVSNASIRSAVATQRRRRVGG